MKKLVLGIMLITLNSCDLFKSGINFEIDNQTNSIVRDIKFYTSENIKVIQIEKINPNQKTINFLSMKDNKTDGHYILEFTRENGNIERIEAGYYTNGSVLNDLIQFKIKTDTTNIFLK